MANVSGMISIDSMESRFFNYKGNLPIHYKVGGQGPLPVFFLHGFASSHTTWSDIVELFPADRFRIFLIDLKGFGLSAKPRDGAYSIEDQAEMVRAFIREQGFPAIILAGHSMGGSIALRICMEAGNGTEPFAVEKAVLMDCAAYPQRLPKFFRRLKSPVLGPLLLHLIPTQMQVRDTLRKVFSDPDVITPERFERYTRYFSGKGTPYVLRTTVKSIDPEAYAGIAEEYGKVSVPILIIWGEEDRVVKLKNGLRLHGDLPGSQLKIIDNCGHNPHEERPVETFSAMDAFLSGPE
jgi:pimeloyl-ACP methyl ester carboxylesterase